MLPVTHPSQPNYIATVGGETFGLQNNDDQSIPANVSTVVDLLETKGISWAEYQEDIPHPGYAGPADRPYVRKHNPLVSFDSITKNSSRRSQIKSLSDFDRDLSDDSLPQWAFVTPNVLNDGHDTGLAHGARWLRGWLEPLLRDDRFTKRTLVMVSFDENKTYGKRNRVFTVLLGGAVPRSLRGTKDGMYFNHYSPLSTVSLNWDLPSLGRWDCAANAFSLVAHRAGYKNTDVKSYEGLWWNASYPGPLNEEETTAGWWPRPLTEAKCVSGRGVLPSVVEAWGRSRGSYNYTSVYPYDDSFHATRGGVSAVGVNDRSVNASESPLPTPAASSAMGRTRYPRLTVFSIIGIFLAWVLV